jgi:hypothetical protein
MPIGTILEKDISYDKRKGQNSVTFIYHDADHSEYFLKLFAKLSDTEKVEFLKIIKFLRSYRSQLTKEEQIIFGSAFFIPFHENDETDELAAIIKVFRLKDRYAKPAEYSSIAWRRFHEEHDFGVSYRIQNMNEGEFTKKSSMVWQKIIDAYNAQK